MAKENSAHRLAVDCIYEALILLMKQKPYSEISITDITNKAGVSRMAYYRNYQNKDDILIDHLKQVLKDAEARILERDSLTKREYWMEFLHSAMEDPINDHIIDAGLFEKTFDIQLDYVVHVYRKFFDLDLNEPGNMLLVYRKLGELFGCMFYLIHHRDELEAETFIDQLSEMMTDKSP